METHIATLISSDIFDSAIWRILTTSVSVFCLIALNAHAAPIMVTNTTDSGAGSLRQAFSDAHNGDTVNFGVTGVITLTDQLLVDKSITIHRPGSGNLTINANLTNPVFYVSGDVTATIAGLIITNGSAQGGIPSSGGGVRQLGRRVFVCGPIRWSRNPVADLASSGGG
jgi:hypothetical protein